jgi:hypothetical protein
VYLLLPIDTHLHQRIYIPLASLFLLGCVVSSLSFGLRWRKSERGPEPKPIDVLLPSNRSWAANNICATHTRDFDPSVLTVVVVFPVLVVVQTAAKKLLPWQRVSKKVSGVRPQSLRCPRVSRFVIQCLCVCVSVCMCVRVCT